MVNPFTNQSIQILKEAFPKVQESVIDDMLWSAKGNVNEAFEMLLSMTNGPPPDTSKPLPKPLPPIIAKPLSVREELNQWRQDLTQESRQRANSRNVQPSPRFSNVFRSSRQESTSSFQRPLPPRPTPSPYTSSPSVTLHHNRPPALPSRNTIRSTNNPFRNPTTTTEPQTSFNPFEEQDLPPPAYNDIQRDTLVHP